MNNPSVLVDVILFLGCAITVAASWAMTILRDINARLHFMAPVTSVGGPIVAVALVITNGVGLTSGQIVLIVALLAFSGPALGVAIARAVAQRDRQAAADEPE